MLKRLSSAISTAHAISLAIREAPDAIRECVELARGNVELREELDRATRSLEQYNEKRVKEVTEEFVLQRQVSDWRGQCDLLQRRLTTLHNQQDKLLRELEEERSRPEDPDCEDYPEGPRTWRRAWKMLKKERREQGEIRGKLNAEVEFWKAACDRWLDWACHIEGGQKTPGVADSWDGDSNMMARITAALNVGNKAIFELESWRSWARDITAKTGKCHELRMSVEDFFGRMADNVNNTRSDLDLVEFISNETWLWSKERITQLQVDVDSLGGALVAEHKIAMDYAAEIAEAREQLEAAQKERAHYECRVENQASEIAALRNRVTELVCERDDIKSKLSTVTSEANELARAIEAERREYQAKLARHEAAERWHQVTDGEGELPPEGVRIVAIARNTMNVFELKRPDVDYRWRYLSSEDVVL